MENKERNLVHVNLDNTYIEYAIFSLFKLDIINFVHIKAVLAKEFNIQPSEIDKMVAWEYELFMKELNSIVKEENDKNKSENDKYSKMSSKSYINEQQRNIQKNISTPKIPNVGNFNIPKF